MRPSPILTPESGLSRLSVSAAILANVRPTQPALSGQRRAALWLLLALLPMLTFAGHWPSHIDIPGTNFYLALPFATQGHEHAGSTDDHGRHCHSNAASCTDVPAAAGVSFALMNESIAALGVGALMVAIAIRSRQSPLSTSISPERRPPKQTLVPV